MDKRDYITLFNGMHPNFFEKEGIRALKDGQVFDEMLLNLKEFDEKLYDKRLDENISFGFYEGTLCDLKAAVEKVDPSWVEFFSDTDRIYCGYIDRKVASFCLVEDNGIFHINGDALRIGGPGCVGTLPEYRDRGIGLTMVKRATQVLKEEGFDYSQIHYTGVAAWYRKLGYETFLRWNKNGIL